MTRIYSDRVSLVLIWALLVFIFATGCDQAKQTLLIPELESRLGQAIAGEARIGDARYDSQTKRIVLKDVILKADDGSLHGRFDQVTALSTEAYSVNWVATEVTLNGGSLKVHLGPAGRRESDEAPNLPTNVTLKNIELVAERGPVSLHSAVPMATVRPGDNGFEFDANLQDITFTDGSTRLQAESIEFKGEIQGDVVMLESANMFEGGRRLSLDSVRIDLTAPHRLNANVRGSVSLDGVLAPVGTDVGNQRSRFAETEIQFKTPLRLREGHPAGPCSVELRGQLDTIGYSGNASCTPTQSGVTINGSLSRLGGSARLTVQAELAFNAAAADTAADGPIVVRKLHLVGSEIALDVVPRAAVLATPESLLSGTLDATGQLWPTRLQGDLAVHLSKPTLGEADRWITASRLSLTTALNLGEGGLSRSDTSVSLGPGSRIAGRALSRLRATLPGTTMNDSAKWTELTELTIEGRDLSAHVARIALDRRPNHPITARVEVKRMPLSWLLRPIGLSGSPVLHASGVGAGTVTVTVNDAGFDTRGKVHFKRPHIADIVFDHGDVSWLTHSDPKNGVRSPPASPELHAVFSRGAGRVEVQLPNPTDPKAGARLNVDQLQLGRHRIQGRGHLGDRAEVQLTVHTSLQSGPSSARLHLLGPKTAGRSERCPSVPSTARRVHVLCGSTDDGTLDGYVLFGQRQKPGHKGHGAVSGHIEAHGADIWRLLPGAASLPAGSARATASLSFDGPRLWPPDTWSGEVLVQALDLQYAHLSAALTEPARLQLVDGQVSVKDISLSSGVARLAMSGTLGLDGGGELTAIGSLQTYAVAPLLPMVASGRGKLAVHAVLTNGLALTLTPVAASLDFNSGHRLRELRGTASWSSRGWLFKDVSAQVEQGKVTATGAIGAEGNLDLRLTAQDVQLEPDARVALHFSGNVHLCKQPGSIPKASGELSVSNLFYGKHIQFPEVILARSGESSGKPRITLDLKIRQTGPWKLRNGLLDVAMQSPKGLTVTGTDAAPGLIGAVDLMGGRLIFHSDELKFKAGSVRFTSRTKLAARFHFSADAPAKRRSGARVRLLAQGDESKFTLGLRCDAGKGAAVPQPFVCRYEGRDFECPDFTQLASVWRCAPP